MFIRQRWSEPCDKLGNPINPDGTVQCYVEQAFSCNCYPVKNYRLSFNSKKEVEAVDKKSSVFAL